VLREGSDEWCWKPEERGGFSVTSCYKLLERLFLIEDNIPDGDAHVFSYLWKCKTPSKVLAIAWTMLLDRIPTRVNLAYRGVLNVEESRNCLLCRRVEETTLHLFLHCEVVLKVWQRVMFGLHFHFVIPHNLFSHFDCSYYEAPSLKMRRGFFLIWLSSIWVIWKRRNEVIFNNGVVEMEELVENIKVLAWYWSMSKLKIATCLSYEWCWNPRECLLR
jgi:hypothetical protein